MYITAQQEAFGYTFVHAVAAAAGCECTLPRQDTRKVDARIDRQNAGAKFPDSQLELQVKSTSVDIRTELTVPYDLDVNTYDRLRLTGQVPLLLVVVVVPPAIPDWLATDETRMVAQHCAYWEHLRGWDPVDNMATKRVHIPREQRFTVEALTTMLDTIAEDGDL